MIIDRSDLLNPTEFESCWLLKPVIQSVLADYSLSVVIRRTQGYNKFRNGELEGTHARIAAKTVPVDNTIKVVLGAMERIMVPVHFIDPLPVTIPSCQAIVTDGPFCGHIVKVIEVEGDVATVKNNDRSTAQINVIYLCKFSK